MEGILVVMTFWVIIGVVALLRIGDKLKKIAEAIEKQK